MLKHPSSGACDLFDELFHGLYCSGSMCVGVTLWFGWGGVVSGCRLKHCIVGTRGKYGGQRGANRVLVGEPEGKRPLGRPIHRW